MPGAGLSYTVSAVRPKSHIFNVVLEFEPSDPARKTIDLLMPVWTPGHYAIQDYPKNLTNLKTTNSATGRVLACNKLTKNRWRIEVRDGGKVRVEYNVYASELDDTASYIDDRMALINGTSVFVYPEGMEGADVSLKLITPSEWKSAATGMEQTGPMEFHAQDYDVLVDSPIQLGNQVIRSFDVGGAKYEVSIDCEPTVSVDEFVSDLKKIVENTVPIYRDVPFKRYVFLIAFTDRGGGGLEHLNSTVCTPARLNYLPKEEYHSSLGLYSHEFFHSWNVKRMRPKGLGPFDYSSETYTRSLWIAEGVTSYYDDLILRRAGIYSVGEYLDALALNMSIMKALPGGGAESAEESSFDTWIKFYKQNENYPNVGLSYYVQGAVIGWSLDMEIRKNSKGERNLDEVMRRVYQNTYLKEGRGYTDQEFESAAMDVGGDGLLDIFDSRVRGRKELDYDRYLGYLGLKLSPKHDPVHVEGFLGIRLGSEDGRRTVRTVLSGSPAERMGLAFEDEIIGVNGLRLEDRLSFYVSNQTPGTKARLTVARNGVLRELDGEFGQRPVLENRIRPLKSATEGQRALFKGWLMSDWTPEIEYPDYKESPDRRRILDYL
ncbi:MAG TPA: PDZ domain-containing protein [Nitrososphaerales archaeon]|nr:PDZ domain-containing protein [Nitrososphaerales archaeon]